MNAKTTHALKHLRKSEAVTSPWNSALLTPLSKEEREFVALSSKTLVLYQGSQVDECKGDEEHAVLRAIPPGLQVSEAICLNIGCGDRTIDEAILPVDICRSPLSTPGSHATFSSRALLARADALPFTDESVDAILALHMLEHVADPAGVVLHWLSKVKPGGGVGVVVPDWRYTWDARGDTSTLGHKWNPTPELIKTLYREHWADHSVLEQLDSYEWKISFDFVLRKHGNHVPFAPPDQSTLSGAELHRRGAFLQEN
jgi:predicted SAM-dependent methyltransferase